MFQAKSIALIVLGSALAAVPVFGQEEGYRSEVTMLNSGSFVSETTKDGVKQSASKSGGMLGSYRFFFNEHHGVEVDYGYTRNTQRYELASGIDGVKSNSHEMTAAYVFRVPFKRWSAFALAGAGGLVFQPKDAPTLQSQARAAFVYGGGVDVNVTRRMFFRAQYRGLVYNSPTWDIPALAGMDRITHRAEPSAGFGFRF